MIKLSDGKIGTREFMSIVLFAIGIKFSDTTPDLMFQYAKNAAWMIPIFCFIAIAIPFAILLSLLKKHKNKGLPDLVYALCGKPGGFVVSFLLFFFIMAANAINTRSYVDIINTMYYQQTPIQVLYLMLMISCFFVAIRGVETMGRVGWIILPYIQIFVLLLIVFVWHQTDLMHIYPIGGPGLKQVISQSVNHSSIFGEMIFMAAFYPYVRAHKDFQFAAYVGFGFACLQIAVYLAVYIFVFDYPAVNQLVYPFHQLARAAAIGQTIANVEALFFGFWVISSSLHFAIYLYLTALMFAKTMRMTEFEPLLLPFAGLTFFLGLIPENVIIATNFREWLLQAGSFLYLGLPFVLWLLDRWRGRVNRAGA